MRLLAHAWTVPMVLLAAVPPGTAEPRIQHEPAACLLAESYPRLSAVVTPSDQVVRARVLFRPESNVMMAPAAMGSSRPMSGALHDSDPLGGGGGDRALGATASPWYAVVMAREGDTFSAVLPRPRMAARKVRYFIEVTDAAAASVRDREHVAEVVGSGNACRNRKVAEVVASAQVVVEVPPGAPFVPPVPQGFSPVGATAVEGSLDLVRKSRNKGLFLVLGGAALGGAAAASQLSGGDSPAQVPTGPLQPGFAVVSVFPAPGSHVSTAGNPTINLLLRIMPAEPLPAGTLNLRLYSAAAPARTCGRMRSGLADLALGTPRFERLHRIEEASACGVVDRVRASLEDAQGRVSLATGTSQPDLVISLVFTP